MDNRNYSSPASAHSVMTTNSELNYFGTEDFTSVVKIGEGHFSKVYKVILKTTGEIRALKVPKGTNEDVKTWMVEVRNLQ